MALPLEPSDAQLRSLLDDAVRRVVAHVGSLAAQPADGTAGAAAVSRALIEREPPEDGSEPGELLDLLFDEAIPASFNNAGPGFLAYIPGGGQPYAAAADLISAAVNRYTGVFAPAPVLSSYKTRRQLAPLPRAFGGPIQNPPTARWQITQELAGKKRQKSIKPSVILRSGRFGL